MQKYDGKSSFVLYNDWAAQLNKLTLEQRGVLITNVFAYNQGAELMEMDAVTDMLFSMICAQIDRDTKSWEQKKERRKAAGAAGGRASGAVRKTSPEENCNYDGEKTKQTFKNEANVTFASNLKQSFKNEANEAVTVSVPVPVTVPVPVPVPATVTVSTAGAVDNNAPAAADGESALRNPSVAKVMSAYMDRINPTPSQICLDELSGFARELGAEVCIHAMQVSLDEKKTQWSYIRAILRGYREDGVRCLADIQAREEKRCKNRAREPDRKNRGFQRHGESLSETAKKAVLQALEEADDG